MKLPEFKAWNKSCGDCAIKRGYTKKYLLSFDYPFMCVHREDLEGKQRACAVWKEKIKIFQGFKLDLWEG